MAEVLRVEPSKFCDGEAWFVMSDGRKLLRKINREVNSARSSFPTPMIRSDSISPIVSQADGKTYDSLSGLYASYRADGNPQGVNYEVLGNDTHLITEYEPPKADDNTRNEIINRTLDELGI